MKTTTCQYCGQEIRNCALQAHENVCKHRPDDADLAGMFNDGMSIRDIAEELNVSRGTVGRWLIDAGLREPDSRSGKIDLTPPFVLVKDLAPMLYKINKNSGCTKKCPSWELCKTLQRMNLWPLCCAPMAHEVQAAIDAGYDPLIDNVYKPANGTGWNGKTLEVVNELFNVRN